jgi:tetratricopeptide (TPR) repeat protein
MGPEIMKRRLNVKRLIALFGGLVLFGLGVHLLHGVQVKRQAGILLTRAQKAEDEQQYLLAIDYLRRYLGFRSGDTDALARYGRLLAREDVATTQKAYALAFSVLEGVLARDPTREEERRLLIDLGFKGNRHKESQYHIEQLLGLETEEDARRRKEEAQKRKQDVPKPQDVPKHLAQLLKDDPKKGELVGKLAQCYVVQGTYEKARQFYELAVLNVPGEVTNYVGLAWLLREHTAEVLRSNKDPKLRETPKTLHTQADQLLDRVIKANPGASRSYFARAQYRRRYPLLAGPQATIEAIESDLHQALKLADDNQEILLALAEVAQEQNEPSRARAYLKSGQEKHPRDWRMYLALSRLERGVNRPDDALTHLRLGLKVLPGRFELLWEYADVLVGMGSSEARGAIDGLKNIGVSQAERDVLSARLLVRDRQWAAAVELLVNAHAQLNGREYRERSPFLAGLVERCNLLLTQCYEGLGDSYRAQHIYQRILSNNPRSLEARLGVARTYSAMGQDREAEKQYRQLARLPNGVAPGSRSPGWFYSETFDRTIRTGMKSMKT